MTARRAIAAALAPVALLLGACSGGSTTTTTSATTSVATAPAPSTSTGTSATASAAPSPEASTAIPEASSSEPEPATSSAAPSATAGATGGSAQDDEFFALAKQMFPRASRETAAQVRSMACETIGMQPTRSAVDSLVSGFVEQSGVNRGDATRLLGAAVRTGCPQHASLLR